MLENVAVKRLALVLTAQYKITLVLIMHLVVMVCVCAAAYLGGGGLEWG